MRRVLCATAVCGGLALAGCVGITDPATNVGQTTARLNAHGHTDDTSAHFYFRYANQEADLPTATAKRTPTRTVPAHRPNNGKDGYFGENVTGLSPGRVYLFELCGADDTPGAQEMCGGQQRFFTDPTMGQDSFEATLYDQRSGFYSHHISAASGPQGQNPDGLVYVNYKIFPFASARVTCFKVETVNYTTRAAIGVVGRYSDSSQPYGALYTVSTTLFEPNRYLVRDQAQPDCEHADFSQQAEGGAFTIHDAN